MQKINVGQAIAVFANIGVLAGIVFLAYEVRQNTQAIESVAVQSLADQGLELSLIGVENPELRLAFARAGRGLEYTTPEDFSILQWYYTGLLRAAENRYQQVSLGTLSGDTNSQTSGSKAAYRHPFFGFFWQNARSNYSDDFAQWVDANLVPLVQESRATVPDFELPEVRDALPRASSSGK